MDLIRRHLTEATTLTDDFTDGYIRSVFTDRFTNGFFPSVKHDITDGIKIRRYISSGNLFFGAQISSVKPSANGFFVFPTDIATEWGITDERKGDGHMLSVMIPVNKSPTNF
jgi:hypothetical protein